EDEPLVPKLTKGIMKKRGYDEFEFFPVLSAKEALKLLEKEKFDVVISDYKMPGMNGLEFLEELRRRGNKIPFIIFTGKGEEKVAIEAINKGANRYIKKDEDPRVLFDTLARYIHEVVEERRRIEEREKRIKELEEMNMRLKTASNALRVEEEGRGHIDAYSFFNEHLDIIILGILAGKEMSMGDIIKEIHQKYGIWVAPETLKQPMEELEDKGIIERKFSRERKVFTFKLRDEMEGLFLGPTFSKEMLDKFLQLTEGLMAKRK
ncbi:MAG: response regulator, partial [Candidatus Methanospirareceae archaeon]